MIEFAKKFITEKAENLNGKAALVGIFALKGDLLFYKSKLFQVFSKKEKIF